MLAFAALVVHELGVFEFLGTFPPSEHRVEKICCENEAELNNVCSFLRQYSSVRIDISDSESRVTVYRPDGSGGHKDETFEVEEEYGSPLKALRNCGFEVVEKRNDCIYFDCWSSFGKTIGLMFSENAIETFPDWVSTRLVPLNEKSWYYFEWEDTDK